VGGSGGREVFGGDHAIGRLLGNGAKVVLQEKGGEQHGQN